MAAFAREPDNLQRLDPPARRRRSQNANSALRRAQRRVPADARVRARDPARASTRRRRRSTPRSRGSRRRASCVAPDELQGVVERAAPGDAQTWPSSIDATLQLLPQTDLAAKCATQRHPADRRRRRSTTAVHDRRGELQGVLVRAGRPRRRGPELRRQRHRTSASRPAAATRRVSTGPVGRDRRQALRQRDRAAARHAAGLPGQAPAVQARRPLLQEHAARPQRRSPRRPPDGAPAATTRPIAQAAAPR